MNWRQMRPAVVVDLFVGLVGGMGLISIIVMLAGSSLQLTDPAFLAGGHLTTMYSRDFRLGQSVASTPADPVCIGDSECVFQCTAVSATYTCLDSAGAAVSSNQGTGATSYTDPLGRNALDLLNHAKRPTITSTATLLSTFAGAHTLVYVGTANNSIAVASVEPVISYRPTGCSDDWRGEEPLTKIYWGNAGGTTLTLPVSGYRGASFGWGLQAVYWTGTVDQNLVLRSMGQTRTTTLASNACSSGGTLFFHDDTNNHPSGGSMQSFTLYNTSKAASLPGWEMAAAGLAVDASSPVSFVRDGQEWRPVAVAGSRLEPMAPGMPSVTSRGIEIHPGGSGSRPNGTGWVLDSTTSGLPKNGLIASSWTDVGTPTVNSDVATGLFAAWATNSLTGMEMDEIVDDDGAAGEGKIGTLACSDSSAAGAYTIGIVARTGTTGTTTDKMRLGLTTDGTVGADCTTWIRVRDGAVVSTLTSTPEFYICGFAVTGSPTSVKGRFLVGATDGQTGSIIVEAPTCTSGSNLHSPIPQSLPLAGDEVTIPASETATWPPGSPVGLDLEQVFTVDMVFPPPGNAHEPANGSDYIGVYVWDAQQSGDATTHASYMIFGSGDGTHPSGAQVPAGDMYLQFSIVPSNAGADADHCKADTDGITKVVSPAIGISSTVPNSTYVVRIRATPRADLNGFPRVDLHIYFDTCANPGTCHATTERQVYAENGSTLTWGITTGRFCALASSSDWGQADFFSRLNATARGDGAVARFTVKGIE